MAKRKAEFSARWDLEATLDFIFSQQAQRVTLQFPDDLLSQSSEVAASLEAGCRARGRVDTQMYVLADTTFNSMSVDEVAAQHVNANCIVHYGRASLAPVTSLPAYFVFPRAALDPGATGNSLTQATREAVEKGLTAGRKAVVVLPDQLYLWALPALQQSLAKLNPPPQDVGSPQLVFADAPTRVRLPAKSSAKPQPSAASMPISKQTSGQDLGEAARHSSPAPKQAGCGAASCCSSPGCNLGVPHPSNPTGTQQAASTGLGVETSSLPPHNSAQCQPAAGEKQPCGPDPGTIRQTSGRDTVDAPPFGRGHQQQHPQTATKDAASTGSLTRLSSLNTEAAAGQVDQKSHQQPAAAEPRSLSQRDSAAQAQTPHVTTSAEDAQASPHPSASHPPSAHAEPPPHQLDAIHQPQASPGSDPFPAALGPAPQHVHSPAAGSRPPALHTNSSAEACIPQDPGPAAPPLASSQNQSVEDLATAQPEMTLQRDSFLKHSQQQGGEREWQHTGGGLAWDLPRGVDMADCMLLWLGSDDAPQLQHLHLTYSRSAWMHLDPSTQQVSHGLPSAVQRLLRRRYFLTEKAKDANIIGIVVGTLGDRGYLQAARHVRALAQAAGKKTYTMLMGRPSPAKLANFPEIEVFVMVADAPGLVLDDSKDYYAPVITPWEALLAFDADLEWTGEYKLGFQCLLDHAQKHEQQDGAPGARSGSRATRQSLLDGGLHASSADEAEDSSVSTSLTTRMKNGLQVSGPGGKQLSEVKSAADFLATRRTYTGLEAPMTGAPVKPVEKAFLGRSGRAASYQQEPQQQQQQQHLHDRH